MFNAKHLKELANLIDAPFERRSAKVSNETCSSQMAELERQIIVQFCNAEGDFAGPELQVSVKTTVQQLQGLLHQIRKDEEPCPYALKIAEKPNELIELQGNIEETLNRVKTITSETSLCIMFYPLAAFRIRPVMRCTATIQAHSEAILTVSFSPDSRFVASGSGDTTIRLWDINTETPIKTLKGHTNWVLIIIWSPDNTMLASAGMDKVIKVWYPFESCKKSDSCRNITLSRHVKPVTCLAWQPLHTLAPTQTAPYLASGSLDCVIYIWDVIQGHSLFSFTSHTMPLTQLRFSGSLNKSLLYSTSRDSTLKVWDVTTQQLCYDLTKHAHWINTLALNTDYIISSGYCDHTTECYSINSLEEKVTQAKKRYVNCFKNTCGSTERVVTGSDDCTLILWEPFSEKKIIAHLTGHQQPVNHVQFSPNGQYIATASFDKSIRLWDGVQGTFIATLRGHVGRVYQLAWSADSRYIVSGSSDSTVKTWNLRTKKLDRDLPGHADEVYSIAWSFDGSALVSGSKDCFLKIWKH